MKRYLIALVALAMAGPLAGMALPAAAQSSPPPLPVLTPEQSTQLDRELANYRRTSTIGSRGASCEARTLKGSSNGAAGSLPGRLRASHRLRHNRRA